MRLPLIAIAAALAATPAIAATPVKSPAKPAASVAGAQTAQQPQHAVVYLRAMIAGLQSEKVEAPVKETLVGCLYNNSLGKITESMDRLIAENTGKISRDNPSQVLTAIVQICGYKPGAPASGPGR